MKERLLNVIEKTRSWKLIIHNNPDPDAIASSYAFSYLLSKLGKRAAIYYSGIIGRAENKEMVKRLGIPLKNIDSLKLKEGMNIAMFDCQPGGGNQPLGKNIIPKIVVDHHFFRNDTKKALFYDVRENIGSSSTIVAQYIKDFGTELNNKIATALYYGIKTDTMNFTRDFTKTDLDILNFIIEKVSLKIVGKIENPPLSKEYFKKLCLGLSGAEIVGGALTADLGKVSYPDICAEIADLAVRMRDVKWVIVFSFFNGFLYFSIRTKSRQKVAGKIAVSIVKKIGSGGGHENSAGGMVKVANFEDYNMLKSKLAEKFFKKLNVNNTSGTKLISDA
jgi:nanoRNase/pAp phosphatase (c-di-AMP/oligoRNAs hydrolase)